MATAVTAQVDAPAAATHVADRTPFPLAGTDYLFAGFQLLLFIEYLGLGHMFPPLGATRFPTFLAWGMAVAIVMRVGGRVFTEYLQNRLLAAFVAFTALSLVWAYVQFAAFTAFRNHFDYLSLFAVTLYLVDRPHRVKRLALLYSTLAIILIGLNIDKLSQSTRVTGFMGAFFLGDGNDFAWAMLILLPFGIYLATSKVGVIARLVGAVGMLGCLFAVFATQSRGATIALGAALFYYWLMVSRRKLLALGAVVMLILAVLALAPKEYFERMNTLNNPTEESSATARLIMWGIGSRMAMEKPFGVGAGNFSHAYGLEFRNKLRKEGRTDIPDRWLNAHSVYFRAVGEYGFMGAALILLIIATNIVSNVQSARMLAAQPSPSIAPYWPSLINMSIVGYAVAGTFLGGLTYPHIYILTGLTASARRFAENPATAVVPPVPAPAAASKPAPLKPGRPRPRALAPAPAFRTPLVRPARGPGRFFS